MSKGDHRLALICEGKVVKTTDDSDQYEGKDVESSKVQRWQRKATIADRNQWSGGYSCSWKIKELWSSPLNSRWY